jgi:hypothetical protein
VVAQEGDELGMDRNAPGLSDRAVLECSLLTGLAVVSPPRPAARLGVRELISSHPVEGRLKRSSASVCTATGASSATPMLAERYA